MRSFQPKGLPNAPTVAQYLDDALVVFPDNARLKTLSKYWKTTAETEKDKEAYTYVEEKCQQYELVEKLILKVSPGRFNYDTERWPLCDISEALGKCSVSQNCPEPYPLSNRVFGSILNY